MKDLINLLSKKYIWFTLVGIFLVLMGWVTIGEIKAWWNIILGKIDSITIGG